MQRCNTSSAQSPTPGAGAAARSYQGMPGTCLPGSTARPPTPTPDRGCCSVVQTGSGSLGPGHVQTLPYRDRTVRPDACFALPSDPAGSAAGRPHSRLRCTREFSRRSDLDARRCSLPLGDALRVVACTRRSCPVSALGATRPRHRALPDGLRQPRGRRRGSPR